MNRPRPPRRTTQLAAKNPGRTAMRAAIGWELGQLAVRLLGVALVSAAFAAAWALMR